ncbi:MAG: biopolymer transporter ExbD [Planctomycetes bacterium]|nr:biopolymer transporter ExbD [Planctomycetota bacterium]
MVRKSTPFDDDSEVDMTPLIDVVFLILIFFMVTSTFTKEKDIFNITLPKATSAASQKVHKNATQILISKDGEYVLASSDDTIIAKSDIGTSLDELDKKIPVIIRCDAGAPMEAYAYLTGVLNELKFFKHGLVIDRKD